MGFEILCSCGRCAISLRAASPQLSLLCGCEDCRQALAWVCTEFLPQTKSEIVFDLKLA